MITVATERRGEIERIQREFEQQFSPRTILRATSQAINGTVRRSIPRINKQVKSKYNITQKYLSRMAEVSPFASPNSLYAGIQISQSPIPIIAFKPKQAGSSISVSIQKGKAIIIRDAFLATMKSGHKGVYSRGHYEKSFIYGKEKTSTGKTRISERNTASPLTMGTSKSVAENVQNFMGTELDRSLRGIMQRKIDKMANQ